MSFKQHFSAKFRSGKEKRVIKHQAKIDCSLGKDTSHNNKRKLCSRCDKQLLLKLSVISTETSVHLIWKGIFKTRNDEMAKLQNY